MCLCALVAVLAGGGVRLGMDHGSESRLCLGSHQEQQPSHPPEPGQAPHGLIPVNWAPAPPKPKWKA